MLSMMGGLGRMFHIHVPTGLNVWYFNAGRATAGRSNTSHTARACACTVELAGRSDATLLLHQTCDVKLEPYVCIRRTCVLVGALQHLIQLPLDNECRVTGTWAWSRYHEVVVISQVVSHVTPGHDTVT